MIPKKYALALQVFLPSIAILFLATAAQAQWLQSANGSYNYNTAANWTSGNINGVFPSTLALSSATVNATFSANSTLSTGLDFFSSSSGTTKLILIGTGADRTVTLGGDVRVFLPGNLGQGVANQVVGFGSQTSGQKLNVDLGGVTRTFNVWAGRSNGQGFELANDISNGGVLMNGPGILGISGNTSFTGPLAISQGQVFLTGDGALATTSITLGATQGYFSASNGFLNASNRGNSNIGSSNIANYNRISDSATINSTGGKLMFTAQSATSGTETIGTVNLNSGFSAIQSLTQGSISSTDPSMTIAFTTLNRTAGATVAFAGGAQNASSGNNTYALGQASGIGSRSMITFGNGSSSNVGGIIPWGVIGANAQQGTNLLSFATYGSNGVAAYGYDGNGTEIAGAYSSTLSGGNGTNLGNIKLTTADTSNGNFTVNSLTLAADIGTTTSTGTITVQSGAILSTTAASRIYSDINVNGREAILYGSSNSLTITGQIKNTGGNGVTISGNGLNAGLTTATSSVTYNTAQTYTGPTYVNSGVLRLQAVNAIPTASAVRVDPNALINMDSQNQAWASLSGDGKVEFAGQNTSGSLTNTLTVGSGNTDTTFSGLISSTFFTGTATGGNLTKVGTGSLTLSGAYSTYSGTTSVANGALVVGNNTYSAAANRAVTIDITADQITLASHGLTNGQTVIFTSNNNNPGSTNNYFQASTPMIVTNVSGNTFQLTDLVGGPVVDFTSAGGTVQLMLPGALGNSNSAVQLGVAGTTNATDNISLLVGGAYTMGRDITVNNQNTSGTTTLGGNTADSSLFSGAVALNKSVNLQAIAGGNATFSGVISGSGFGLTKTGNGTVILSGNNTYTGNTTVSAGTLTITGNSSLPGFSTNGRYSVASGATLGVYNAVTDADIASMVGTTNFAAGAAIGFDTTTANRTYSSNLANTSQGALGLNKLGSNTLTLSGANTYTGTTTVTAGTLATSAADRISDSSAVTVASGATFLLGGSETVGSIAGAGNYSIAGFTLTAGGDNTSTT